MTYDEQIVLLTKNPDKIANHWFSSYGLFKFVSDTDLSEKCGCLTMIRKFPNKHTAVIKGQFNEEITKEIANDLRIPTDVEFITVASLSIFKEWQERLDKLNQN